MSADASLKLRIAARAEIAQGIHRFTLVAADAAPLPPFCAGAHLALVVPNGLRRRYSLCSDPADTARYEIAVKREPAGRGGSASLCDAARGGDARTAEPPRNDFGLSDRAGGFLFIAGGIGITPIIAMLHALAGDARPWKLIYLTRSPELTAFTPELASHGPRVTIHHDGGDPERGFDLWPLLEKPGNRHVYCCGPKPLMDPVRDMTGHWPASAVHFEDFGAGIAAVRPEDTPFTVRLARSGREIAIPADRSILDALREAGLTLPSSCESGSCGTCRTRLLEGEAEHRDLVLEEHERARHIMICVSRARAQKLVLDL
jgi:phthalate 4,5-dioxygenase reductase component